MCIYYEFKNATDELEDIVGEYRSYVHILRMHEGHKLIIILLGESIGETTSMIH